MLNRGGTAAITVAALAPGPARPHHFMDGGLPQALAQGLLSGLGPPPIGLDPAAFIVAARFFRAGHRLALVGTTFLPLGIAG